MNKEDLRIIKTRNALREALVTLMKDKQFEEMIDYICKVVKKWIKLGASGFRLDVVDELTNYMLYRISQSIKEEVSFGQNASVIGEVWEDVSTKVK